MIFKPAAKRPFWGRRVTDLEQAMSCPLASADGVLQRLSN
jgi:hypothetical protein